MIVTRSTDTTDNPTAADIERSIPYLTSYGCANRTENAIVIIHSFSRGVPDDYLVVPKGWVKSIVPLRLVPVEAPEPEPKADKPSALQLSQR